MASLLMSSEMAEKRCRKMRIKQIGFFLLLLTGTASVAAMPADGRGARETVRAYYAQDISSDRNDARNRQAVPQPALPPRNREFNVPDSSGSGTQAGNQSGSSGEQGRRQGKMTPDERRALRRQIDEAGHDIYVPKR